MTTPDTRTLLTAARDALAKVHDIFPGVGPGTGCGLCGAPGQGRAPTVHRPTCLIAQLNAALAVPAVEWVENRNNSFAGFSATLPDGRVLSADYDPPEEAPIDAPPWDWRIWPAGDSAYSIAAGTADTLDAAKVAAERAAGVK